MRHHEEGSSQAASPLRLEGISVSVFADFSLREQIHNQKQIQVTTDVDYFGNTTGTTNCSTTCTTPSTTLSTTLVPSINPCTTPSATRSTIPSITYNATPSTTTRYLRCYMHL